MTAAAAAPAAAASGGAGIGSGSTSKGRSHSNSSRRETIGGHTYPGDSVHMGDRILRQGMSGHDVRVLQSYLSQAGYQTPVVGYFGSQTEANLIAFQSAQGLSANGVLTWTVSQALRAAVASVQASSATAPPAGANATMTPAGLAVAPAGAPEAVKQVIAAANRIAFKPYVYGGGHGSWNASGYDCSGSVSFALHGGGLLSTPEDSSELESYGSAGAGQWITIYANAGHAYMYVAGLRFDTGAQSSRRGDRWSKAPRSSAGYVARHPTGY